jgi:hypothetical protein
LQARILSEELEKTMMNFKYVYSVRSDVRCGKGMKRDETSKFLILNALSLRDSNVVFLFWCSLSGEDKAYGIRACN